LPDSLPDPRTTRKFLILLNGKTGEENEKRIQPCRFYTDGSKF
jgi:hypothetical protein